MANVAKSLSVFAVVLLASAGLTLPVAADGQATSAPTPNIETPRLQSEFVFEARVQVDPPVIVGTGPHGLRRIVPISGGTVTGPRLRGKVLAGADWQFVRAADDVLEIEAKYTLESHDGVRIMVTNRGFRRGPKEVIDRLARGEKVDPSLYYFRTTAQFEAPVDGPYAWLNQSVFVGVAAREADAAIIRFFEIK